MISNSLGAMPRAVYDRLNDFADTWATLGVRAWGAGWWNLKGEVGDKIGPLMGAAAGSVLVHENASIANSILLSALDLSDSRRDKVIACDQDFPSDVYTLRAMLPAHFEMHIVRSHDGISIDTDELLEAIDERTRLVSLSHVLFRSAYIMPVAAIVEKAHRVGAQVLLNGYHSVGVIPVDVTALNVDFYIGGTLKWLCGGPGGVFMYVRPDLLPTLQPKITGWFAHQQPFAFAEEFVLREDAYRLANGTPGIASLYAIQPGAEIIAQVGVDNIRQKSLRQTALVIDLADAAGYEIVSPRDAALRAGTVTLRPDHAYEVSRELLARNYVIDYREGAGIRVAPHFYNSDDEVRSVMEAIASILLDGSWKQHSQGRDFVT
ncbi:MAG: aminotransferase class V-fold PLP-dependent enzyme [Burkholderiales bacterium]|nr:aminotransferase class V-fold PLP-dependent enzyme [Anaerolineae bacterium]